MKLIDLLVKELPKRGGWPEDAVRIHQDYDGETWGWLNHDSTERLFTLDQVATNARKFDQDETCENMVTREQYEAALAASKAVAGHDGWIQWDGGECPVEEGVLVDIRIRNGKESHGVRANESTRGVSPDASHPFWRKDGNGGDIIAYRLHNTDINHRGNDDRLEQDLNECIGQDVDMPEWNGEGLPPVGVECEFKCATGEWVEVEITAIARKGVCFVERGKNGENYVSFSREFRPLRTEAEKLRDEVGLALYHAINWNAEGEMVSPSRMEDYKKAYDAIAAGKIPGVKLEGK